MSVGTAFHPRTAPLNRKMQWREWSGYYASSAYADFHDIEYNAIREAAAVIDVSPLYKYRVTGPDAIRLADRVITRDATKLKVGQVYYTPWCDEHGKVIDDGTVHRVAEDELRWTAADPQYPLADDERRRPGRGRSRTSASRSRRSRSRARSAARCSRRRPARTSATCATSAGARRKIGRHRRSTSAAPATRATSATSCGSPPSDAEAVWDAAVRGRRRRTRSGRPGMLALDVTRLEAGPDPARGRLHVRAPRDEPGAELQPVRDRPRATRQLRQGGLRRRVAPSRRSRRPAAPRGGSSA